MDTTLAVEPRKENRLDKFQDRRAAEWRAAAERHEHAGSVVLAQLFRNEAWRVENGEG